MKRIISIMIVVAAALSCATATAQIHFGVRGGLTLNNIKFRDWGDVRDEFNNRIGFNVGVSLEVGIPVTGLSVEAALLYNHRSVELDNTASGYLRRDLLTLPVYAKFSLLRGSIVSPYVFTGPEFSFLISDKWDKWNNQFASFTTAWHFGVGIEIVKHVQVSLAYGLGMSKSVKQAWYDRDSHVTDGTDRFWNIGVGYIF
jgi:hypothetical protein